MAKAKLYKVEKETKNNDLLQFIIGIIVYAIVLVISTKIFKGIYIASFMYAIIAALILSLLNSTIKPLLVFLTLPLSVITFGIAYPLVNMIILKLCDIIMDSSFELNGLLNIFFISIFISLLKLILDKLITKKVGR